MSTHGRDLQRSIAAAVNAELGGRGWTRKYLAAQAGITEQTMERIMNLKRDMDVAQLGSIADALGVTTEHLMAEARRWRERTSVPTDSRERASLLNYLLNSPQQDEELVRRLGALESQMGVSGVGVQRLAAKIRHDRKAELTEMLHALAPDTGVDHTG